MIDSRGTSSTRILGTLLLLFTLAAEGCKKKADDAADAEKPTVTVQAEKVVTGSITETVEADSVLAPRTQASIVPRITAPVKRFYVQRGTHVRAGQVLAVLENADLAANVADTRGGLTQAQATYTTTTGATVPEDLTTAQANVEQAKSALEVQGQQTESRGKLFQEGAIPRRDYDTARAALVQAQGTYDTAAQHLAGLRRASSPASIENAQGVVQSARGKLESAAAQLSYATIRSPMNGVVTERTLFPGETAQAGSPLLTVMDTSSVLAKVHLPGAVAARLKVGNKASIHVQDSDEKRDASVALISPAADPGTTTIEVWVSVPNAEGDLHPGTAIHVVMEERTLQNVTTIPVEAIVNSKSGETAVMVIGSDGTAHQRVVELGATDGKDSQVLKGVHAGEMVVTTGSQSLEDGTKVKVGPAEDDDDAKGGADADSDSANGAGGGKPAAGEAAASDSATGGAEAESHAGTGGGRSGGNNSSTGGGTAAGAGASSSAHGNGSGSSPGSAGGGHGAAAGGSNGSGSRAGTSGSGGGKG